MGKGAKGINLTFIFILILVLVLIWASTNSGSGGSYTMGQFMSEMEEGLVFETMVILFMARPQNKKKALAVICLGNLLSFLAPYVLRFLGEVQVPTFGKYYIVGTIFLAATLAVEFPIEYYMLVKDSQRKRWLVAAIILANIVSTGSVALIERTFCRGYWV